MNQPEDTPSPKPHKPLPWLKIMVLFTLCMVVGAVVVQLNKAKKSAALDRQRSEEMEVARRSNLKKAVESAQAALDEKKLDEAERSIKLLMGLDTQSEFSTDLEKLKLSYAELKAEAAKEAEAVAIRDGQLNDLLASLQVILNGGDIEGNEAVISTKKEEMDKLITAGVSNANKQKADELSHLIDEQRKVQNTKILESLITAQESYVDDLSIRDAMAQIKQRADKAEVAEELKNQSASTLEMLQKKLDVAIAVKAFEARLKDENWTQAETALGALASLGMDGAQIELLKQRLTESQEQAKARDERVSAWMADLREMHTESFNASAMALVEQVLNDVPKHAEALALKQKLQQHLNLLRVPGDVASLDEAVRLVNENGRIILGEGTFYAELSINKPISLEGQGVEKTILESRAEAAPAIFINHREGISHISKISIHGTAFDGENERNALLVISGDATVEDCEIVKSPGHGIAVLSGKAEFKRCKSSQNGWDGITVKGQASQATITDCLFELNSEHGVDFWDGASGTVFRSKISSSSGSGAVATGKSRLTIAQTTLEKNGECGIHLSGGAVVKLDKVVARENAFSGVAIQGAETHVEMNIVAAADNGQAGYFVDPESQVQGIEMATGEGNKEGKLVRKGVR